MVYIVAPAYREAGRRPLFSRADVSPCQIKRKRKEKESNWLGKGKKRKTGEEGSGVIVVFVHEEWRCPSGHACCGRDRGWSRQRRRDRRRWGYRLQRHRRASLRWRRGSLVRWTWWGEEVEEEEEVGGVLDLVLTCFCLDLFCLVVIGVGRREGDDEMRFWGFFP